MRPTGEHHQTRSDSLTGGVIETKLTNMSLRALVLLACSALVLGAAQEADSNCGDYCVDPVRGFGNYVCCNHPGRCPTPRKICTRLIQEAAGPTICEFDYECPKTQKCCLDACLEHKTCKTSV